MCGFLAPYVIGRIINERVSRGQQRSQFGGAICRTFLTIWIIIAGDAGPVAIGVLLGRRHQHRRQLVLRGLRQRERAAVVEVAKNEQHQLTSGLPRDARRRLENLRL
jgi:hypothetical protein